MPSSSLSRSPREHPASTIRPVQEGTLATIEMEEIGPDLTVSRSRTVAIISCITCITAIGNLLAGLLTVCIPVIAADLGISPALQLWPAAAFALACGCTLLPCGAAADVLGCRRSCLLGALLQAAGALGAGLATTPAQLTALRGIAGVAASFCLPGAVGVAAHVFPAAASPHRRMSSRKIRQAAECFFDFWSAFVKRQIGPDDISGAHFKGFST